MTAAVCLHYFVSGRVQGVGYRYFVQRMALELNVRGWVRNLDDARVELVACADEAALSQFEQRLWQGPPASDVRDLRSTVVADTGYAGFAVR